MAMASQLRRWKFGDQEICPRSHLSQVGPPLGPRNFAPHRAIDQHGDCSGLDGEPVIECPTCPGLLPWPQANSTVSYPCSDLRGASDPSFGVQLPRLGSRIPSFLGV